MLVAMQLGKHARFFFFGGARQKIMQMLHAMDAKNKILGKSKGTYLVIGMVRRTVPPLVSLKIRLVEDKGYLHSTPDE